MTRWSGRKQGYLSCWLALVALGCGGGSQPASTTTTTTSTPPPTENPPSAGGATDDAGAPEAADAGTSAAATRPDAGAAETVAAVDLPPMPTNLHAPPHPWAQMTHQQKMHWMGTEVLPAMTQLLHAYDANRFATVTCATCHGANARAVNFHMPNTLYPLPTPMSPAWNTMMQSQNRMFHFMAERVEHAQAQLLGMTPFDPATRQGFGCFGCHAHAPGG